MALVLLLTMQSEARSRRSHWHIIRTSVMRKNTYARHMNSRINMLKLVFAAEYQCSTAGIQQGINLAIINE